MYIWLGLGALAIAMCATAIRAAFHGVSKSKLLDALSDQKRARIQSYLEREDRLRETLLYIKALGQVAFVIACVFWTCAPVEEGEAWDNPVEWLLAGVVSLLALVLFVESLAPLLGVKVPARALAFTLPVLNVIGLCLTPISKVLNATQQVLLRAANVPQGLVKSRMLAEEIVDVVSDTEREEKLAPEERDMIENVVELHEAEVSEIMTPRTDVQALPIEASLQEAIATVNELGHSRLPVYEENVDQIVGTFYIKDVLKAVNGHDLTEIPLREYTRKPHFIPETKKVPQLLQEFRRLKLHMAIVLDEYGGTAGLVTLEDILEEIVGDIVDEFDEDESTDKFALNADGSAEVDAKMPVDDVNEQLGLNLPEGEDFETVGGFVFSSLGKVPDIGERFTHDGIDFEILAADARRIQRLRITPPSKTSTL